jgi:protein-disulfide isomerase
MHTQLKALPSEHQQQQHFQHHHQSNPAIQQLATPGMGQQGTIMTKTTNNKAVAIANHHIPVAFVEFTDVQCAGRAMQMLQGKYLLSSDRGAIRIEYAKSSSFPHHPFATAPAPSAILTGRAH